MNERPLSDVPIAVLCAFSLSLLLQIGIRAAESAPDATASNLGAPPAASVFRLGSFGDPVAVAKLLMLYVQSFDARADNPIRYQSLDYTQLVAWLDRILRLDPTGQYPLHAASLIYGEVPDAARQRKMLELVYREFFVDPERRWPWLAHAAYIAKHELKDLPLARSYAVAIQQHAHGPDVPLWAKQMEAFILEDMNELETAKVVIGGYIASGRVNDPRELRFLEERLRQITERLEKNRVR